MDHKKIAKPLILLISLIIFCSIFARTCSDSETLAEYAAKNPKKERTEEFLSNEKGEMKDDETGSNGQSPVNKDNSNTGKTGNEAEFQTNNETEARTEWNEEDEMTINPDRIEYKQGFYYEPLSEEIKKKITGISYPVAEGDRESLSVEAVNIVPSADNIQIAYDDLRYVSVLYNNFKGIVRTGELICNEAIAQDLVEIFYELYESGYQIEQIALVDEYGGDDTLSMLDNNTSCFNYRVVDGTTKLSKHALGLAIDINPFFNPYVVYKNDGTTYISPQGSETYADRSKEFAFKIDENDLCYKLFTERGFIWGGNWNSSKDYQHFQKVPE